MAGFTFVIAELSDTGITSHLATSLADLAKGSVFSGWTTKPSKNATDAQQEAVYQVVFLGSLVVAVVLPVYRAEYLFGFVLSMTFTSGGVLSLIVASFVALVSSVGSPALPASFAEHGGAIED